MRANLFSYLPILGAGHFPTAPLFSLPESVGNFFYYMAGQAMWRYPWDIHGAVCAVSAVLIAALQVFPMLSLLKYKPGEHGSDR